MEDLKPTAYTFPKPIKIAHSILGTLIALSSLTLIYEIQINPTYIPYKNWVDIIWPTSIFLGIICYAVFLLSILKSKLKEGTAPGLSKTKRIIIFICITPLLCPLFILFFNIGIRSAMGHTITHLFGSDYASFIVIEDTTKREPSSGRYYNCPESTYHMKIKEFNYNTWMGPTPCLSDSFLDKLPKSALIVVEGKETFFGRTVKTYKHFNFNYDKDIIKTVREKTKPSWINLKNKKNI